MRKRIEDKALEKIRCLELSHIEFCNSYAKQVLAEDVEDYVLANELVAKCMKIVKNVQDRIKRFEVFMKKHERVLEEKGNLLQEL